MSEFDKYKLIIDDKTDLRNVKAHCTCGKFTFEGDWDDLASQSFKHEMNPKYKYFYTKKSDHQQSGILSRQAGRVFMQHLHPEYDITQYDKEVGLE